MFTAALFIIVKVWLQPTRPSVDEWINKVWYIHKVRYYSVIETNDNMMHTATWMKFETMILGKRNKAQNYFIL
jgi:hypothetical protein